MSLLAPLCQARHLFSFLDFFLLFAWSWTNKAQYEACLNWKQLQSFYSELTWLELLLSAISQIMFAYALLFNPISCGRGIFSFFWCLPTGVVANFWKKNILSLCKQQTSYKLSKSVSQSVFRRVAWASERASGRAHRKIFHSLIGKRARDAGTENPTDSWSFRPFQFLIKRTPTQLDRCP